MTLGQLLVIVEYCRFGNILDYLIEQRNTFINQLNEQGSINPPIETDLSRLFIRLLIPQHECIFIFKLTFTMQASTGAEQDKKYRL